MTPDELIMAVREAIDRTGQKARDAIRGPWYVIADGRVLQRHQPMECGNRSPEHSARHIVCSYDCDGDWPCPDFVDLAARYGITVEETGL